MPTVSQFPAARYVPTNGIDMAVYELGAGKPLVLCHGWPELAYSWRHQMPALATAGYHVIAPDQRGYGATSGPDDVASYDMHALTGDLVGLLDHYGYDDAVFVGHDMGAVVVWNLAMLHPERVSGIVNLSVPFMPRGPEEWVEQWERKLGEDFYIVHFNRQPGVAAAVFEANTRRFLRNIYRTEQWLAARRPARSGMTFIDLALADDAPGRPIFSAADLDVFVNAFEAVGFHKPLNWYRNFTSTWELLGGVAQRIVQPTMMLYGKYDMVPQFPKLADFVPDLTVKTLDCGHWIQQEKPAETTALLLAWLEG